ncbi:MAG: protein-export chaperone SecB [Gammaproteobacteria bacterium]
MTETDFMGSTEEMSLAGPGAGQFALEQIYLKDCSFESPLSPAAFTEQYSPELSVNIQTRINGLVSRPEAREVVLSVTVDARVEGDRSLFLCETHMGALVAIGEAPEAEQQRVLGARVPEMLFPYVRETLSNLVVRGGFMPMMLQPIDFDAIYEQQSMQQTQPLDG